MLLNLPCFISYQKYNTKRRLKKKKGLNFRKEMNSCCNTSSSFKMTMTLYIIHTMFTFAFSHLISIIIVRS